MIKIVTNGSKWSGQQPDTIEELIKVLNIHALDPRFEDYGNFVNHNPRWVKPEQIEKYKGCAQIWGNFLHYSHGFNIITDNKELINKLSAAIEQNINTIEYQEARAEYIRRKEYKKELERKWINKEISYIEFNNYMV